MSIQTINPTTGEVLETFEAYSQAQINEALDQAQQATFQDEAYAHWQDATRTAPVANTLFVAAGLLAGGAVATYFLLPHQ